VKAFSEGPGRGSEFVVRLPVVRELASSEGGAQDGHNSQVPLPRRKVLVVDDNVDAAESLAVLLRYEGQEVWVAHDGASALEAVEAHRPEVVVLDIGMPDMDGYEVARRLRRRSGGDKLTLIALTGWGAEEDRRRSREAGFDHHLTKPMEPSALETLLAQPK
jgi:CheY-like chemotaxis protein